MTEGDGKRGRAEQALEASRKAREARQAWTPERRAEARERQQQTRRENEEARRALLEKIAPSLPEPSKPAPVRQVVGPQQMTEQQRRVYQSQRNRGIREDEAFRVAIRSKP